MPNVITIIFGASVNFENPIGYQSIIIVYWAAGYHFKDSLKIGLQLMLLVAIITLILIPKKWTFENQEI